MNVIYAFKCYILCLLLGIIWNIRDYMEHRGLYGKSGSFERPSGKLRASTSAQAVPFRASASAQAGTSSAQVAPVLEDAISTLGPLDKKS